MNKGFVANWYPLLITAVFTVFTVFMKWLARRDGDAAPLRNDVYVAQSFLAGSLSALTVYLVKGITSRHPAALDCLGMLLVYVVIFVALAVADRYSAWNEVGGKPQRRWFYGILLPNTVGAICYVGVFLFAKAENL